jgi:hypothetical protein
VTDDALQPELLTLYNRTHILEKTVDDLQSFSRGIPNFVLSESVEPLQDRLNIFVFEEFLYEFDCAALRKVPRQRKRTHLVFAV